ncbi:MAG: hypothetical protein LLG06_08080 [Desulfobacteraceae bacterium]|nr:hypothetical protein [Desulfobacteraceae bacterium]
MELKRKIISRESEAEKPDTAAQKDSGSERDKLIGSVMQSLAGDGGKGGGSQTGEPGEDEESRKAAAAPKLTLRRKLLLFGAPALCVVLVAAGFLVYKLAAKKADPESPPAGKLQGLVSITRPVPVPDFREMLNFLIAVDAQGRKTVTAFRLEVGFQSASRYRNFKENSVMFRDTVYAYLLKQNIARQTSKSWHEVLGRDLIEYIGAKLPQSRADTIKLTQIESF